MSLIHNILWGCGAALTVASVVVVGYALRPACYAAWEWVTGLGRRRHIDPATAEHELVPEPHVGATQEGTGIVEAEEDLLGVWTVPLWEVRPLFFEELDRRSPVRLDWEPESFTASWSKADLRRVLTDAGAR